MRTPSRIRNIKKKPHRCKVNKNKYSSKSIAMGDRNFNISRSNLENINEVLRVHKLRQAEGKGSWKLVPKDSCEVYKDRRKRQAENKRTREEDEEDFFNDSNKTRSNRKPEHKQRKNMSKKTNKPPGKSKQRTLLQDSSQSSKTSTYYSSTTSYTSVSDMEYDDG